MKIEIKEQEERFEKAIYEATQKIDEKRPINYT